MTPLLHMEIKPVVYCHRKFSSLTLFFNVFFMLNEWNLPLFSPDSTNLSSNFKAQAEKILIPL